MLERSVKSGHRLAVLGLACCRLSWQLQKVKRQQVQEGPTHMSTTLPAIAPAAAAAKAKPSAVVRRGPPARRAASPPSVVTYGASSAKAWPAPCLVGREARGAAEREQRLGTRLTLDLGATEADEEVSSDWPRPAFEPFTRRNFPRRLNSKIAKV